MKSGLNHLIALRFVQIIYKLINLNGSINLNWSCKFWYQLDVLKFCPSFNEALSKWALLWIHARWSEIFKYNLNKKINKSKDHYFYRIYVKWLPHSLGVGGAISGCGSHKPKKIQLFQWNFIDLFNNFSK